MAWNIYDVIIAQTLINYNLTLISELTIIFFWIKLEFFSHKKIRKKKSEECTFLTRNIEFHGLLVYDDKLII